ncbi:KRAB-A domain-containing protein 2 [Trichinella sp. T8]|nr:KRAB-A domain-containing protein 2 [Trichinella sp. T8]
MERFFRFHCEIKLLLTFCESSQMVQNLLNEAIRCIASIEEMFDVINDAHQKIGHGGEKKHLEKHKINGRTSHKKLAIYFSQCHKKRARKLPKSLVVKPLVSTNLMSRAQVDLINFQTMPDGDFKYIMTYLNHFTKFCILSPLMLKRAEEMASKLLKIFLTFGAPSILQSDNGQEFSYVIIAELKTCWPELKLVTGRPRHPQSQGAVERLNGVVQDKLAIWMRENGCKRWSMGLKFVQLQINVSVHETTGQSPFKIVRRILYMIVSNFNINIWKSVEQEIDIPRWIWTLWILETLWIFSKLWCTINIKAAQMF